MRKNWIAVLERQVKKLEAKRADPDDRDDKRWAARRLSRFLTKLAKKGAARHFKQRERRATRRAKAGS